MSLFSFFTFFVGLSTTWASPQELLLLKQENPVEYNHRQVLQPHPTRAGHLRFVGAHLADPQWVPLYLSRYQNEKETTQVRRALLDLIHRSAHALPSEVLDLFSEEPDIIRATIVELTSFGTLPPAEVQKDTSPLVRAAFIRQVAHDQESSTDFILRALEDSDEHVLADAARAAHQRGCMEAIPYLARILDQYNDTVALRALYALSKLDKEYARRMVQKHSLTKSTHRNLALFAQSL